MNVSKFTLGNTLTFIPKSTWPTDKDYVKAARSLGNIKNSVLIKAGRIDIGTVDIVNKEIEFRREAFPSNDVMIHVSTPTEKDEVTGTATEWDDALVRIVFDTDFIHVGLAVAPQKNGDFKIIKVIRFDKSETSTQIYPVEGADTRVDEIMTHEDMREVVLGVINQVMINNLVPINPNVIYDKRLKNMPKKEKESYIEYRLMDKAMSSVEYEQRRQDLIEDMSTATNRMSPSRLEEVTQTPKGTSTKLNLMKRIHVKQDLCSDQSLLSQARDISQSILFVEVSVKPSEYELSQKVTYEHLPFNDFMLLCNIETTDIETEEISLVKDGLLVRMKKINDETVRQFVYYRVDNIDAVYTLLTICDLDVVTGMRKQIAPVSSVGILDEFLTKVIPMIKHALHTILSFEPVVKNDPTQSFQIKKRVPLNQRDRYIEYTLDLNKTTVYSEKRKLGGTHASPIEHERRGHWRTYKSGKRTWVDAVTVNKGVGGRIEKDYKL